MRGIFVTADKSGEHQSFPALFLFGEMNGSADLY